MNAPNDTDTIPQTGFDPIAFWLEHKTKVVIYGAVLVIAAVAFACYEIASQHELTAARQTLAQAKSEEDYRGLIQKFPHTVAAGDASLLLAEKLRDDKKYDDAITVLQAMIDGEPNHPLIDGAWLSLASTYNAEGKPDQALDTYRQTATKFADRYSAPLAMLSTAEILSTEGKKEEAKVAYENVNSQFHDSYFASEALQKLQALKK